jgi:hypothetical protein
MQQAKSTKQHANSFPYEGLFYSGWRFFCVSAKFNNFSNKGLVRVIVTQFTFKIIHFLSLLFSAENNRRPYFVKDVFLVKR